MIRRRHEDANYAGGENPPEGYEPPTPPAGIEKPRRERREDDEEPEGYGP